MFAASAYLEMAATTGSPVFVVIESVILVCGLVMTSKAYMRRSPIEHPPSASRFDRAV
jgi:hypothetical protein